MSDKRQNLSKILNQIGRCPSGHRTMPARAPADVFSVELPPVRSDVFLQKYILHLHRYFSSKDQNINTKYIFRLSSWGWLTCNQQDSAIEFFAVLSKCGFHHYHCQGQPQSFLFNNLFIWKNNGEFWYKCIHHCTWKFRVKLAGHPTVADVFIYRRRPAPERYVATQKKILKNRPVPGRLLNSPVMCKSLKSYDVSFICDHSISRLSVIKPRYPP